MYKFGNSFQKKRDKNWISLPPYLSIRDEQEFVELVEDEAGGLVDGGHYSFVMVPGVGL